MRFSYSVICDNTQENREWLEKVGYSVTKWEVAGVRPATPYIIATQQGTFSEAHNSLLESFLRLEEEKGMPHSINCIGNSPLFKAVSAMREDSDYMQWFTDGKMWFLCKRDEFRGYSEFSNSYPEFWGYNYHKGTLTELQERFKEKEI